MLQIDEPWKKANTKDFMLYDAIYMRCSFRLSKALRQKVDQ